MNAIVVLRCLASLALAGFLLTHSASAEANNAKFGYVDMQKAFSQTSSGKKIIKELDTEATGKRAEFQKREADLKKMNEDLNKKAAALSDDAKAHKMQEWQAEVVKFQREASEWQMSMQRKNQELTKPVFDKMQAALDRIAKQGGYTMIFERGEQNVLWAAKDLDITEALVKEVEKSADKSSEKK